MYWCCPGWFSYPRVLDVEAFALTASVNGRKSRLRTFQDILGIKDTATRIIVAGPGHVDVKYRRYVLLSLFFSGKLATNNVRTFIIIIIVTTMFTEK